jgi:signal transduction histidine kinase
MWRSALFRYAVPLVALALVLPFTFLAVPKGQGIAPLFLAVVMVSAWYGGLGPGLLATLASAVVMDVLLPPFDSPAMIWIRVGRMVVFVAAAVLISSLNARQRRLEMELRRRDHVKDEVMAIVAHEMRSPLYAAVNALQTLRLTGNDPETKAQAQAILERQVRALARLIEDMLDVSRIGLDKLRLCMEKTDLKMAAFEASETVRPILGSRQHRFEMVLPPDPVYLDADPARLVQIFVNLLTNAARYTQPGGLVRLIVEQKPAEILVRVSDSGSGLAPEIRDKIFDLFVQGEAGSRDGLGIGLNLVRSLVEMHGGKVAAFSDGPGRGSEFVVRLPVPATYTSRSCHPVRTVASVWPM